MSSDMLPESVSQFVLRANEVHPALERLVNAYRSAYADFLLEREPGKRIRLIEAYDDLLAVITVLRKAANHLLMPTVLCSHCDEAEVAEGRLCNACAVYQRKYGNLPSDEVLAKRYGWPQ